MAILGQIERIQAIRDRREVLAQRYRAALPIDWTRAFREAADVPEADLFRFVLSVEGIDHTALRARCEQDGVAIRRGVDSLLAGRFEGANDALDRTVSIPFYPALSDSEAALVILSLCANAAEQ